LPARTVEIVRIPPTDEQKALHDAHMQTVASIVRKPYFTEMDLLRLRMALLMCRMAADSTFLVDKQRPAWSSKLERLAELLDGIAAEPDRKVVLFSEWTTMLDLIEHLLDKRKLAHVRLDGSVPQKKRQALVSRFQADEKTRFFLATNAGSTGLNLQAANTVINVDLPWNPAVLEQRIARAHRMGQTKHVHVFVLVTGADARRACSRRSQPSAILRWPRSIRIRRSPTSTFERKRTTSKRSSRCSLREARGAGRRDGQGGRFARGGERSPRAGVSHVSAGTSTRTSCR
jgi:superfamily II DNA/RNA helicase